MINDDHPIVYGNSMQRKFAQRSTQKSVVLRKNYRSNDYKLSREEQIEVVQKNLRRGFTPEKIKRLQALDRIENSKFKRKYTGD